MLYPYLYHALVLPPFDLDLIAAQQVPHEGKRMLLQSRGRRRGDFWDSGEVEQAMG